MTAEMLLAFVHYTAILMLVSFLAAELALCRTEWINRAVIARLARLDSWYGVSSLLVLVSGLLRMYLGIKGSAWYWNQWELWAKLFVFAGIGALSTIPTLRFRRWHRVSVRDEAFRPHTQELRSTRHILMIEAHALIVMPLLAAMLAR